MYQDFRYNLKQGIADTNMDILAIRNEKEDMLDEISKRNNPTPKDGEIVIKIDQILKNIGYSSDALITVSNSPTSSGLYLVKPSA